MQSNPNNPANTNPKNDPKNFMKVFFIGFGACLLAGALVWGIIALATGAVGSHDQLVDHGNDAYAAGRYDKALGHFEKALKLQENSVEARLGLCMALEALGEYGRMEEVALRGTEISPATYEFYAYVVKAKALGGDLEGAYAFMQEITNEHALLKIDRNQPGEVSFSVKPGVYDSALTVELSVKEGSTIYYTTDGSVPGVDSSVYTEPFAVEHGTLTLRGFAMSESGLISPPFDVTYVVRDGNAAYEFKDAGIAALTRAMLGVSASRELTYSMLDNITSFNTRDLSVSRSVKSLEDLKEFVNLTEVHLYNQGSISDLAPLSEMPNLRVVTLDNCAVTPDGIKELGKATQITHLTLDNNSLQSVDELKGMTSLTYLSLCNNMMTGVKGLEKLEKLTTLVLVGNQIGDLSQISQMKTLTELSVAQNKLTSLMGINAQPALTKLDISGNKMSSLTGIGQLSTLETLIAVDCGLTDIAALSKLTGLISVDMSGNSVKDFSALRQTGVTTLTLVDCNINSLSTVSAIRTLRSLNVSDNPIEDVTPIISLPVLEGLDISNTKVTQVVGLRGCGTLRAIRAVGCKLADADGLAGSKITLEQ